MMARHIVLYPSQYGSTCNLIIYVEQYSMKYEVFSNACATACAVYVAVSSRISAICGMKSMRCEALHVLHPSSTTW